jgi:hypothetical protein
LGDASSDLVALLIPLSSDYAFPVAACGIYLP